MVGNERGDEMRFGYVMSIVLLLIASFLLGGYFIPKEKIVEKKIFEDKIINNCDFFYLNASTLTWKEYMTPVPTITPQSSKYGYGTDSIVGIPASVEHPPNDAVIREQWNNIPVAIDSDGNKYYFISGFWFTQEEFDRMPMDMKLSGVTPYTDTSD